MSTSWSVLYDMEEEGRGLPTRNRRNPSSLCLKLAAIEKEFAWLRKGYHEEEETLRTFQEAVAEYRRALLDA